MSIPTKSQAEILSKLGIANLNPMQLAAQEALQGNKDLILLSPTGTGKTLAFLLPLIDQLDHAIEEVQLLIIVPSRELAMQIEQVMREMGTGFKVNAVYGGRAGSKDKVEIKHRPAVLIGTPGRIADHLRRGVFEKEFIQTLVLDEFDKSLEIGFEQEMQNILDLLPNIKKRILTSATQDVKIPKFVRLHSPVIIDFLADKIDNLKLKRVLSPDKNKLATLIQLISKLGNQNGIIFCNFKDSIQQVSDYLADHEISHGTFHGDMEQLDRERSLIKFRNGTHQLLLATDLAARGIDVPELGYIIHFQLPNRESEFIHRNGRTARMHADGTAYILQHAQDRVPDFARDASLEELDSSPLPPPSEWSTVYISGGRTNKISKGDIVGLFLKQGKLGKDQLGVIELKTDCAFVGVKTSQVDQLLKKVGQVKLKEKKVRISLL